MANGIDVKRDGSLSLPWDLVRIRGILLGKKIESSLQPAQPPMTEQDHQQQQQVKKKTKKNQGPLLRSAMLLPAEEAGRLLGIRPFTITMGRDIRLPIALLQGLDHHDSSAAECPPSKRARSDLELSRSESCLRPSVVTEELAERAHLSLTRRLLQSVQESLGEPLNGLAVIAPTPGGKAAIAISSFTAELEFKKRPDNLISGEEGDGSGDEEGVLEEGQCSADEDSCYSSWMLRCRWAPRDDHIASAVQNALRL